MTSASHHDDYVPRLHEEAGIDDAIGRVRADGKSRVVLLYGGGGVGKTRLVRALAKARARRRADTVWVEPIDVDDSAFWLLSHLERQIAGELDTEGVHFRPYYDYLTRLPRYTRAYVGHETVISHLDRINEEFVHCYDEYVTETGKTVVITLDTVEAIRNMFLLLTLTQWMKALPKTLFILSGRPPAGFGQADPISDRLADPHQSLEFVKIDLVGFDEEEARTFIDLSTLRPSLTGAEKDRLVELTAGQPLWLALAVNHLERTDPPTELAAEPDEPHERTTFRRRLVTTYQSTEFWSETIRRLAVLRQSVSQQVWQEIMSDRGLPPGFTSWDQAWHALLQLPWVRPRANRRYVTLHDALAEELAQGLIPLHDRDGSWRRSLWQRAADIYANLTSGPDRDVQENLARLTDLVRAAHASDDAELIDGVAELDARKREIDQMKTAAVHYRLLYDYPGGSTEFVTRFDEAARRHDMLFQELLCHELERFLPHRSTEAGPLADVLRDEMRRFGQWLAERAPEQYLDVGLRVARFLTQNEQPSAALELLFQLPESTASVQLRYRLANERGNASMRIPGRIDDAERYFQQALEEANRHTSDPWVRRKAQALKELGYYFRNLGRWRQANESYHSAREVISGLLGPDRAQEEDREELASIQTNWAYLKALQGSYEEARNLVESALEVRQRIGRLKGVGVSYSVYGEVLRYDRQFTRAWQAYHEAEDVFQQLKSWPWLGTVYQEQAICLFQAEQEGTRLVDDNMSHSRELIGRALEICRDQAVRAYPSALNRAGRILGHDDVDEGLRYLEVAIDEARRVADGWFMSANLVEYLDLCLQAWIKTEDRRYRRRIDDRIGDVEPTLTAYSFSDLHGRWELLQGHLAVRDAAERSRVDSARDAVGHFSRGFIQLADQSIGSHGLAAISREFDRFRTVFADLPLDAQKRWYRQLRTDWSNHEPAEASTSLLACLESLY